MTLPSPADPTGPEVLAALDAQGRGVRVEFKKQGDRLGHTLCAVTDQGVVSLCTSVEDTAVACFPASPPWTELYRQQQTLLLTGATSQGHWSLTVRAAVEIVSQPAAVAGLQPGSHGLIFDVACRLKAEPTTLGSGYRCTETVPGQPQGDDGFLWTNQGGGQILALPLPADSHTRGGTALMAETGRLRFEPSGQVPGQYPATVQWRYALCCSF